MRTPAGAEEEGRRAHRHELLRYQDKLEGVLHGLDRFMPNWTAERREATRECLAAALTVVRAELADSAGLPGAVSKGGDGR